MRIYTLKDNVAGEFTDIFMYPNNGVCIRNIYPVIRRRPEFKDLNLYTLGNFDNKTGKIDWELPTQVDWEEYKFAETKSEKQTEEEAQKTLAEVAMGEK